MAFYNILPCGSTHSPLPLPPGSVGIHPFLNQPRLVPIYIVTHPLHLPPEFLYPLPERQLVVGFDCEGVDLSRHGALCVMQLAFQHAIYLVDAVEGGMMLMNACKPALESAHVVKVIHDCKRDSEALYFQFGIKLNNVMDTQIAFNLIEEQEGRRRASDDYISFVGLVGDPRYCGVPYQEKEGVRFLLMQDPMFWLFRPFSDIMIRAASDDVRFLLYIYGQMMERLNERSIWYLSVRGSLHCRCFCINNNNYADWPPLAPLPDSLKVGGNAPEEEILSIIDVPPGKMGLIVGKRGSSIVAIKASCTAEIHLGGDKGPADKVFVMGPISEVRKAEIMLRGRIMV